MTNKWNGEGLPPVGTKCLFSRDNDYHIIADWSTNDELLCKFHTTDVNGNDIGVYRHKSGTTISIHNALIKPLDTRTDEQKAADDMSAHFELTEYSQMVDAIKAGLIHSVKWTGK